MPPSPRKSRDPPVDRMEALINQENDVWQQLGSALETANSLLSKIRSDGVKLNVGKALSHFITLSRIRENLHEEMRDKIARMPSEAKSCDASNRVAELEVKVLDVLDRVQERLTSQEEVLAKLNAPPRPPVPLGETWTTVVRRPKPKTKPTGESEPKDSRGVVGAPARQLRPPRSRPPVIVVSDDSAQFPELLKTMRRNVNPQVTGDSITRMRRTMRGELLIEVSGGSEAMSSVKAEVERSLGPGAKVRKLEDMSPVELRDLDEETTSEEVRAAAAASCGSDNVRVVNIRKIFGGAQAAVVMLPSAAARKLCAVGRLRVGLVYARARPSDLPMRCFKCHSFGHMARECSGDDRGSRCWRCGEAGHFSSACTAPREKAAAYRSTLVGQTGALEEPASAGQADLQSAVQGGATSATQDG